jgi:ABC-type glycerol-3-phosphate transport system substrate-binding protein
VVSIKEETMRGGRWLLLVLVLAAIAVATLPGQGFAQQKKIVMWTHWDQNPEFNKWYATRGKDFSAKSGFDVEVVTVPYQGYEAKYLAAFMGKSGAPDMSWG